MSILIFSSAIKNKNFSKKKRLHKVYKVHEPIKKSYNNYVNTLSVCQSLIKQ